MAKDTSIVDETKDTPIIVEDAPQPNGDLVEVTVTKFGDGQVSTGLRDDLGDIYAKRGDKLMVAKSVAASLEARGLAEAG